MSKVRVYEIAKKLNISTKEILDQLKEYGFDVHSHMSSLQDEEVKLIIDYYNQDKPENQIIHGVNTTEKTEPPTELIIQQKEANFSKAPEVERRMPDLTHHKKSTKSKNKKKNKKAEKAGNMGQQTNLGNDTMITEDDIKIIEIPASISVRDLADKMGIAAIEIIKCLMKKGKMATINQEIDFELASQVAEEFEVIVELEEEKDLLEEIFKEVEDKEEDLEAPPPAIRARDR